MIGPEQWIQVPQNGILDSFLDLIPMSLNNIAISMSNDIVITSYTVAISNDNVSTMDISNEAKNKKKKDLHGFDNRKLILNSLTSK